ncbi:hypothetical protein GEMRC1_000397 [Eukaryota sp. GEM-RC1]
MTSLLTAIEQQYIDQSSSTDDRYFVTTKDRKRDIIFPGEQDASSFYSNTQQLDRLSLSNLNISSIGDSSTVSQLLPNVHSLDLSVNSLSWSSIAQLSSALLSVSELCLANNPLLSSVPPSFSYPSVTTLILNNNPLTFETLVAVFQCFPNVEELVCAGCGLSDHLPSFCLPFKYLKILDLSDNCFTELDQFGSLNVSTLILNSNNISSLNVSMNSFNSLENLFLGNNNISEISTISNLDNVPSLRSVRLSPNEFLNIYPRMSVGRAHIIGRLQHINCLNGTTISETERRDCEKFYLSRAIDDVDSEDFSRIHPRFAELVQKHGDPVKNDTKTGMKLIPIKLINDDDLEAKPRSKKLPLSMTLLQVKELFCTLFKVPKNNVCNLKVLYKDSYSTDLEELDSDSKNLNYFSLTEGEMHFSIAQ